MERVEGEKLTDEERTVILGEPYEEATAEYLESSRRWFIERGWGDPDLYTEEDYERDLQTIRDAVGTADLPGMIDARNRLWKGNS